MRFIDLERRFHALTDAELTEPERLAALSEDEFSPSSGWSELLEYGPGYLASGGRGREDHRSIVYTHLTKT